MGFIASPADARPLLLTDPRLAQVESLFFGIGAQKAGTTWLHNYLFDHPDACLPEVGVGNKELHYWDSVRRPHKQKYREAVKRRQQKRALRNIAISLAGSQMQRDRERQWSLYHKALHSGGRSHKSYIDLLFFRWKGHRAVGEISPGYALLDPQTLSEMALLSDSTKFVFVMRDPLARLLSGLRFGLHKANQAVTSEALTVAARRALKDDPDLSLAKSRYEQTIQRLEAAVPKHRISYHFYESMFQQDELDRLTDFLSIAPKRGEVDKMIHTGSGKTAIVEPQMLARARHALQPTYDFIAERFRERVPIAWDCIRT